MFSTLIIMRNYSDYNSKLSCDTEDWSNDAKNSALHHRNKLHFKVYSNRKYIQLLILLQFLMNNINAVLVRRLPKQNKNVLV